MVALKAKLVAAGPSRLRITEVRGQRVGRIVGFLDGPLVDFEGNPHGAILARSLVPMPQAIVIEATRQQREVLLSFDSERSDRPIVVGLLEPRAGVADAAKLEPIDVHVDGKRTVLEGRDEVVLRCGKASVTLRRNGRIVVRGTHVETSSQGVNRIKGGSVQIN